MPEGTRRRTSSACRPVQYLNAALARALNDQDAPVALKVVKSLQEIVGRTNLLAGPKGEAITDAMRFGDRQVRIESAMTIAQALPTQPFPAKERVVPLLAEAIHQTGQTGVLVLFPAGQVNAKVEELKGAGYTVIGAQTADELIANSANLPAADVIIVTDEMPAAEITQLFQMANGIPRLERAAKIVISKTITASPDRSVTHTAASDAAGLKPVIDASRPRWAARLVMDATLATSYASAQPTCCSKLAINNNKVLDVASWAQQSLTAALEDSRLEVVKAVAKVLQR